MMDADYIGWTDIHGTELAEGDKVRILCGVTRGGDKVGTVRRFKPRDEARKYNKSDFYLELPDGDKWKISAPANGVAKISAADLWLSEGE